MNLREMVQAAHSHVKGNSGDEEVVKKAETMQKHLSGLQSRLKTIHEEVEDLGGSLSLYEHELLILRQELQKSAQSVMLRSSSARGQPNSEQILAVENGLKQVQQRAVNLQKRRQDILTGIREMKMSDSFADLSGLVISGSFGGNKGVNQTPFGIGLADKNLEQVRWPALAGTPVGLPSTSGSALGLPSAAGLSQNGAFNHKQVGNLPYSRGAEIQVLPNFSGIEIRNVPQEKPPSCQSFPMSQQLMSTPTSSQAVSIHSTVAAKLPPQTSSLMSQLSQQQQLLIQQQMAQNGLSSQPAAFGQVMPPAVHQQANGIASAIQQQQAVASFGGSSSLHQSIGGMAALLQQQNAGFQLGMRQQLAGGGNLPGAQQLTGGMPFGTGPPGGLGPARGGMDPINIPGENIPQFHHFPSQEPFELLKKSPVTSLAPGFDPKNGSAAGPTQWPAEAGQLSGNDPWLEFGGLPTLLPTSNPVKRSEVSEDPHILPSNIRQLKQQLKEKNNTSIGRSTPSKPQAVAEQRISRPAVTASQVQKAGQPAPTASQQGAVGQVTANSVQLRLGARSEMAQPQRHQAAGRLDGARAQDLTLGILVPRPTQSRSPSKSPTTHKVFAQVHVRPGGQIDNIYGDNTIDRPPSSASVASDTCSVKSEQELVDLVDQLTSQMFDQNKEEASRRANSLPRTGTRRTTLGSKPGGHAYHKPSYGTTVQSVRSQSLSRGPSDGKLSAYERLFGKPAPQSRDLAASSPTLSDGGRPTSRTPTFSDGGRPSSRKIPAFITKSGRSRVKSGSSTPDQMNRSLSDLVASRTSSPLSVDSSNDLPLGAAKRQPPAYTRPPPPPPPTDLLLRPSSRASDRSGTGSIVGGAGRKVAAPPDIDKLFAAPDKISIPERLKPEQEEVEGEEEKQKKIEKIESIRKMLGDLAGNEAGGDGTGPRDKIITLNHIIANQVKQRSRRMAAEAAQQNGAVSSPAKPEEDDISDSSPDVPLPLKQQRESFLI